ncbi:MAG TPA: glycosyltransferase, partial [Cytophagales bacterium]|nr:glycosyltransferase [Cytophagales bacterium]
MNPNVSTAKKILITPLDWGLGHATRCVPVIKEFLKQGCEVQIASSGDALILLCEEFPHLKTHSIVSYDARYSSHLPLFIKMMIQLPKFLRAIKNEHRQIEEIVEKEKIDVIVSDNRYGCYSSRTKNIFLGHQLFIDSPFLPGFVNQLHLKAIQKFSLCWVPDNDQFSLTGKLTLNSSIRKRAVGYLSRFVWYESEIKYDLLVIISGPESQRTLFEELIIKQLKDYKGKYFIVRGLPAAESSDKQMNHSANHLPSEKLNELVLQSNLILSRPGYSTLMDLATLGKKA